MTAQVLVEIAAEQNDSTTSFAAVLHPLLTVLNWKGDERHILQALPPRGQVTRVSDFRDILARLGFSSVIRQGLPKNLDKKLYPIIFIDDRNIPHLVREFQSARRYKAKKGFCISFASLAEPAPVSADAGVMSLFSRFRPLLKQVYLISFIIGLVALAPTFYNMAIYDHIIAAGSAEALPMLAAGAALALATELGLRYIRNNRLSYFGARLDHFFSCSIFERLLYISPLYTERASVSAQLSRLRDFEVVREFFTGPLAVLFFELPLIALYVIAMIFTGGMLAVIPVVLLVAYATLIRIMKPRLEQNLRLAADTSSRRHEFLLETLSKLHAIRVAGLEKIWLKRFRLLSADASQASFKSGFDAQIIEVASYVLMTLGGVATLAFGVRQVINQNMTTGALIATMILVWRIVAPMQLFCASITRIRQLKTSTKQVQRLLAIAPECPVYQPASPITFKGQITFSRVSLRYSAEAEPALLGVTFEIKPGQIYAIRGRNGSGKSSLLKLILGLYQPQGGSVRIDGVDIRQFDPMALRQAISYVPQHAEFFPGTILDNMLFVQPMATPETCRIALERACAWDEVERLPNKLDTILAGNHGEPVSFMLRQRLNLARAFLKPAAIMLFDEASHSLGKENDLAFEAMVNEARGRNTVIFITHREDYLRLADQILVLEHGELTHAGAPAQVLTALRGKKL